MKSHMRFSSRKTLGKTIGLGIIFLQMPPIIMSLAAQDQSQPIKSETRNIGTAETRSVTKASGFFPDRQPAIHWHDDDWKINLLPLSSPDAAYEMSVTSRDEREKIVKLPLDYSQIDSISRTPNDMAIIIAEINGKTRAFGLIDLKSGKLIENFAILAPFISPNQRFILYVNTDYYDYYNYRLYDTSKTPRENTCGYRQNDPEHHDLDEAYRGFPVYPRKADQCSCSDAEEKPFSDESHLRASDFIWSADSHSVIFADVQDGKAMSLILVIVPDGDDDKHREGDHDGERDQPRTSIYRLVDTEDVCAGATSCDSGNVRSLVWDGNSIKAAFILVSNGQKSEKDLTIPLSKFVPIPN